MSCDESVNKEFDPILWARQNTVCLTRSKTIFRLSCCLQMDYILANDHSQCKPNVKCSNKMLEMIFISHSNGTIIGTLFFLCVFLLKCSQKHKLFICFPELIAKSNRDA